MNTPSSGRSQQACTSPRSDTPAWLRSGPGGDIEVELVGSEDGVSPGQACAFYDSAVGQARVLGGGMISSTVAAAKIQSAAVAMAAAR